MALVDRIMAAEYRYAKRPPQKEYRFTTEYRVDTLLQQVDDLPDIVLSDWNTLDADDMSYIKNKPNVPILDLSGLIPASYLPSYVDDVLEYPSFHDLPQPGEPGKIYVTTDNDLTYRWSGTTYVEISKSIITGVKGDAETDYRIGNVNLTAANIGLGNVVNLDLSKAIKGITRNGLTFTYTCLDGTTGTFDQQDNNTTYSAGTGLSLTNTTFALALTKKLVTDALGYIPPTTDTNTTYSIDTGDSNGLIKVTPSSGSAYNVSVKGLGSRAYDSTSYLPLAGGTMTGSITISQPSSARNVGIIGTYDPNRAAAIWAMGASYQIKADGTTMGSLYGACYAYYGSGYTYGAGKSGGHSFVWAQNGNPTVALGNNVWTSGGFIKNGGTSSQFLKADGSVDSNAYITGITKAMVTTALGYTPPTTDHTYNFDGVSFTSGQSTTGEHNANNITSNGVWYYTSNGPATTLGATTTDGALYSQAYSTALVGQIAQDYRNGTLAVRGKNNGTWQPWHTIAPADSDWIYSPAANFVYNPFGRRITKVAGSTGSWDSTCYSKQAYRECSITYRIGQTDKYIMVGLNSDPTTNNSYSKIDYCWYNQGNGSLCFYENGTSVAGVTGHTSYVANDEFTVEYADGYVRYYHNGVLCRSVSRSLGTPLYADMAFHGYGAIYDVSFQPVSKAAKVAGCLKDGTNLMTSAYNKSGLGYNDYSWLAGWNGYELRAVAKTQFATYNHTHNYLPLSGGTISGTLSVTSGINCDSYINCTNLNAIDDVTISKGSGAARLRVSNAGVLNANNVIEFSQDNAGNTKHFQIQDRMNSDNTRRYFSIWGYNYGSLISASCASGSSYCCVGIGGGNSLLWDTTAKLYVNGNAKASAWNTTSDIRLKDVKGNTNVSIETIANAPLFYFYWKDKQDENKHVGTSAQYWLEVLPEVVSGTDESKFAVDYGVTALTSAITVAREVVKQDKKIKLLEEENKQLKEELLLLKSQINDILTTINKSTNNK